MENVISVEFKNDVKKLHTDSNLDWVDAMIEKFNDYVGKNEDTNEFLSKLEDIDKRCLLIRLFGNYHNQVCNGGHVQYFDNGYASSENISHGCCGKKSNDIDIHESFIELCKIYLPKDETTSQFIHILEAFKNNISEEECDSCEGMGYYDDDCDNCQGNGVICEDDEEGNEIEKECPNCNGEGHFQETCYNCNGEGYIADSFVVTNSNDLDNNYYAIDDKIIEVFNNLIEKWMNEDSNGVLNEFLVTSKEICSNNENINKPKVKLVGTDGNAYALMGKCREAMRRFGCKVDVIEKFTKEAMSGDYNNLLATCCKYCDVY